jgi:hypothetical protein
MDSEEVEEHRSKWREASALSLVAGVFFLLFIVLAGMVVAYSLPLFQTMPPQSNVTDKADREAPVSAPEG